MPAKLLIVDDEEAISWALRKAFERQGHTVGVAASAEAALDLAAKLQPDAVILDVRLPGMDGLAALGRLRALTGDAPVIVVTAFGNLSTAVRAVEGDACVLITGESGTGKELVARALHRHSPRRDRPFLPVHVAALNPNLVESELFGHVKGAFTGAAQARPGLLALADGGTVFLDELADIPPPVQVKLLRALEHDEVLPVGASQPQPLNIRILGATHQDLARAVAEGRFRHDLFFRLNVFQVALPPLRQRVEDVEPLAEHFLRRFEPRALPLLPETVRFLQSLPWFGNVRELRNALEHAAIVARGGPLLPEHFPTFSGDPSLANLAEQVAAAVR